MTADLFAVKKLPPTFCLPAHPSQGVSLLPSSRRKLLGGVVVFPVRLSLLHCTLVLSALEPARVMLTKRACFSS